MTAPAYRDGQEVTVIDAKGVRGRGVINLAYNTVSVIFPHTSKVGKTWNAGVAWSLQSLGQRAMTIEPLPFTEEKEGGQHPLGEIAGAVIADRDAEIARLHGLLKRAQPYVSVPLSSWSDTAVAEAKALADDIAAALSPDPVEGEGK